MARGNTDLDSHEYDAYLAKHKKEREIKLRQMARRNANSGYRGWHFGLGDRPIHTQNKEEFKRELEKRGLMMKDNVRKTLRK